MIVISGLGNVFRDFTTFKQVSRHSNDLMMSNCVLVHIFAHRNDRRKIISPSIYLNMFTWTRMPFSAPTSFRPRLYYFSPWRDSPNVFFCLSLAHLSLKSGVTQITNGKTVKKSDHGSCTWEDLLKKTNLSPSINNKMQSTTLVKPHPSRTECTSIWTNTFLTTLSCTY